MTIRRINRGRNHSYTIDGVKALGVTTALSQGLPKPALPYWSAKRVAEFVANAEPSNLDYLRSLGTAGMVDALKKVPWSERDAAAARGTEVHALAELIVRGEGVTVPEHLSGYVDAAVKFMDRWQVRPLLTERTVASRQWMYAGTFDLVAELPDGQRILFDYKTSASGIWPETALQLAAYRYADCYLADDVEIPMSEVGITGCKAVWLRADGFDVIPLVADEQVFKAFLHVAYVARVAGQMSQWVLPAEFP